MSNPEGRWVFTARVKQLCLLCLLVLVLMPTRDFYPVDLFRRFILAFSFAILNFGFTWYRERRRAFLFESSIKVINWKLFESVFYLAMILSYFLLSFLGDFTSEKFYTFFDPAVFGLLIGVTVAEFLFQNFALPRYGEQARSLYWQQYKDSVLR